MPWNYRVKRYLARECRAHAVRPYIAVTHGRPAAQDGVAHGRFVMAGPALELLGHEGFCLIENISRSGIIRLVSDV
jgi:hypothetical protein